MRIFMLLSILLAFLGVVSASPVATPTPTAPDGATLVILGPRRNGHSDLPSSVAQYNSREDYNRIPILIMASGPHYGDDAIMYNQDEIWNAMREGYEVLQRTRDPDPGLSVMYGNVLFPFPILPGNDYLLPTYYGRFGATQQVQMYAWPLLWTNGYTGFNQNPGLDRVVFNEDGIYLGVITWRDTSGGYRWCPPTDGLGRWIARPTHDPRGWDYSGVPPNGEFSYTRPQVWNTAANQRDFWNAINPGGMPPTGSHDIQYNSSNPVNMNPSGATFDHDDPLHFPPVDNSTGVWRTYVPSNITDDLTNEFAVPPTCAFARDHGVGAYHQSCQTHWIPGQKTIKVRITVSGTGQSTNGWCKGVIENMHKECGGHFNLVSGQYTCDEKYPGTATFSKATDPTDPWHGQYYFGIDMHFYLKWPWAESDADHACMSTAVEKASCAMAGVKSENGKWCRNVNWRPYPPLLEWSNDLGPA